MAEERQCPVCGRRFHPRTGQHTFCTVVCRERANATLRPRRARPARYGYEHQQARREWAPTVAAGRATCSRCGEPILPTERWDLDHRDNGSDSSPAHAYCNRAAGAVRGRELAASHDWRTDRRYQDDPERGVFYGPPGMDGVPIRWSRSWYEWRADGLATL